MAKVSVSRVSGKAHPVGTHKYCKCGHLKSEHKKPDGSCSAQKNKTAERAVTQTLILCECRGFEPS